MDSRKAKASMGTGETVTGEQKNWKVWLTRLLKINLFGLRCAK